jgi:formylglycine-generating enzyme required for sulfatase activity
MRFVFIKPGEYTMGSPLKEEGRKADETQHEVFISKGFYMQTTEVTQEQWKAVMNETPSYFSKCGQNCPVEQISWNEAQEFIKKLNQREKTKKYRLPTEAEWEYACRAGRTATRFSYGDDLKDLGKHCWHRDNSGDTTHKVAQKKANAWGLYDMHGNVWEWCQDRYGSYANAPATDPKGPTRGSERIFRGGAWNVIPSAIRCAFRGNIMPEERLRLVGFRLVREP